MVRKKVTSNLFIIALTFFVPKSNSFEYMWKANISYIQDCIVENDSARLDCQLSQALGTLLYLIILFYKSDNCAGVYCYYSDREGKTAAQSWPKAWPQETISTE